MRELLQHLVYCVCVCVFFFEGNYFQAENNLEMSPHRADIIGATQPPAAAAAAFPGICCLTISQPLQVGFGVSRTLRGGVVSGHPSPMCILSGEGQ